MSKRLCLILNPCAGVKRANRYLADIIRMVIDRGYECVTHVTARSGDATEYLTAAAGSFDRIVCIGGDGTLNETVAGVVESGADCPIGYIPAGSTNDYASSIGLSGDILQAARDALDGVMYRFDLGRFNGRYFSYTASCGAFARTSYSTPQIAKNVLGHAAYILEGMRDLTTLRPIHMRLETEGRNVEGDFILCMITNSLSVGGVVKLDPSLVSLNDGLFEVMLIRQPRQPAQWTKVLLAVSNNDMSCELIEFFTAARLRIATETEIEWTFDGERGERGREFTVENLTRRIRIVLPDRAAETVPAAATEGAHEDQLSD